MRESTRRRYESDFFQTTQEIAYHIDVRDGLTDKDSKERQQETIDKRVRHLEEIERKMMK